MNTATNINIEKLHEILQELKKFGCTHVNISYAEETHKIDNNDVVFEGIKINSASPKLGDINYSITNYALTEGEKV